MLGKLAERGYDVWVGNRRGSVYSNVNRRDGEWSLKERWDFSWADEGENDLPKIVDMILEETGSPKINLMGYSMGSAMMYYGLATN